MKEKSSARTMIAMGCAFASYNIGSGFASGQVPLQYFSSGGGMWSILSPWLAVVMLGVFVYWALHTGSVQKFDNPNNSFIFYTENKYSARFVDIYTLCVLFIMAMMMFSGAGSTIQQYTGIPLYVGAFGLGAVACVVVCLGLSRVKSVLGVIGAFLSVFIVILGLVAFAKPDNTLWEGALKISEYTAVGKIAEPGILGFKNKLLTPLYYIGCCVIISVPFCVALGKEGIKTRMEAAGGGALAGILFGGATVIIDYTLLLNIDYIAENGMQIPVLATIQKIVPWLALPFTVVILCAIFSTVTGFLWLIGRRFAEDQSKNQIIIVICVCIAGIFSGSFIPFSSFVSLVYPISGIGGLIIFAFMLVHRIRYGPRVNSKIEVDEHGVIKKGKEEEEGSQGGVPVK